MAITRASYSRMMTSVKLSAHWRIGRLCCTLLVAIFVSACSSSPKFTLQQDILAAGLSPNEVAVLMIPMTGPGRVVSLAADRPMQPASTMKLLTTAVALDLLGSNWRGQTQLLVHKTDVNQQTLSKPLILLGRSNTDLSYGELNFMLQQLYDQGIRHIPAGLQIDRSSFQPSRPALDSDPFDEAPRSRYNHVPDPLMLQQNMHWLALQAKTSEVSGWFSPGWQGVSLDLSSLQLVTKDCDQFSIHQQDIRVIPVKAQQWQLKMSGEFPINCQWSGQLELFDRDLNIQLAVQSYWRQLGGTIGETVSFQQAGPDDQLLVQHLGRPLPEIVYRVNKFSDNALARLLFANLAEAPAQAMSVNNESPALTQEIANRQMFEWLRQKHISTKGLIVDNGSGLSRIAKISPRQLADVLKTAWTSQYSTEFVASMPIAGVDGTLINRLKQTPAWQRARLKTGTLRDVTALAGYVWDQHNQPWIFVGFVNSPQASQKGRALLDKWVAQLASQ